jgi:hypothetical protein
MPRSADSIFCRFDRMLAWWNRADEALVLARWALGASLVILIALASGHRAHAGRVGAS